MNVRSLMRPQMIAALSIAIAFAHAASAQTPEESAPMSQAEPARTVVEGEGARLEVAFDPAAQEGFSVRYRVTNTGDVALAVFDRGNRHAVLTKKLSTGTVPPPLLKQDNGDVTLSHIALPLPSPAPTVPPTPLVAKVAPGAIVEGSFVFDLSSVRAPKRLRWCLGTAPFTEADFDSREQVEGVEVWRGSFAVVDRQQTLCTAWYDIADKTFAAAG